MKNPSNTFTEISQKTSDKSVKTIRPLLTILNFTTTLICADFISKFLALQNLAQPYQLLPGVQFQLEKNTGIAFSIAIPQYILIPLNLAIFLGLVIFLYKKTDLNKKLSLAIISLMAAGAIGNLFDRLSQGFVTDFISIGNFPVFNLADTFITTAVFLLLLFYDKIKRSN